MNVDETSSGNKGGKSAKGELKQLRDEMVANFKEQMNLRYDIWLSVYNILSKTRFSLVLLGKLKSIILNA